MRRGVAGERVRSIVGALIAAGVLRRGRRHCGAFALGCEPLHLPTHARVVVFAPHPDDETIAAGGLLHRLARAPRRRPRRVRHQRRRLSRRGAGGARTAAPDRRRTTSPTGGAGSTRRSPPTARLGLARGAVHFLGFPDGGLDDALAAHWSRNQPLHLAVHRRGAARPTPRACDPDVDYDGAGSHRRRSRACCARSAPDGRDPAAPVRRPPGPRRHRPLRRSRPSSACASGTSCPTTCSCSPIWSTTRLAARRGERRPAATAVRRPRARHAAGGRCRCSVEEQAAKAAALDAYATQLAFMPGLLRRFLRPNELFGRIEPGVLARIAARH